MRAGLTLELLGGESIDKVCSEAQHLADMASRRVSFTFNSVLCVAVPGGDAETMARLQQEAQRSRFVARSDALDIDTEVKDER